MRIVEEGKLWPMWVECAAQECDTIPEFCEAELLYDVCTLKGCKFFRFGLIDGASVLLQEDA